MKKIIAIILVLITLPTSIIYASEEVILGGDSVGIEAKYDGLYISGTYSISDDKNTYDNNKTLRNGDVLIAIEGKRITDLNTFNTIIQSYKETQTLNVTIIRNQSYLDTTMQIVYKDKVESGLYLKEKTSGIGTMTFYNPKNNMYACLGHAISSNNNEQLQQGNIYTSSISNIQKAQEHKTGEKIGKIHYEQKIGEITINSNIGVYGIYNEIFSDQPRVLTAENNEIQIGKASFYTVIENNLIEKFEIEITNVNINEKTFEFKVIDSKLIERCGGIIHGMSGSPIIQDGKLVGAVTHVLVNDSTRGYGIFIENMLEAAE